MASMTILSFFPLHDTGVCGYAKAARACISSRFSAFQTRRPTACRIRLAARVATHYIDTMREELHPV